MAESAPPPPPDGHPRPSGAGGGQKERQGGVQVPAGGSLSGHNDLVRREHRGQGEPKPSDPAINPPSSKGKSSKKLSLLDYRHTRKAAEKIAKINDKEAIVSLQPSGYSPPRKPRQYSPSPSPPGYRAEEETEQMAVENQFGFADFGGFVPQRSKPSTLSSEDQSKGRADLLQSTAHVLLNQQRTSSNQGQVHQSTRASGKAEQRSARPQPTAQDLLNQQLASSNQGQTLPSSLPAFTAQLQQSARDLLNQQQLGSLVNQGMNQTNPSQYLRQQQAARDVLNQQRLDSQSDQGVHGRQGFATAHGSISGNGSIPVTQVVQTDMVAGLPRSDLLALLMMDMNSKYSDIHRQQAELFSTFKQQPQIDNGSKAKTDDLKSEASEDDSEDEMRTTWSGDPPSSKQGAIQVSDSGLEFWSELIAIDEQGKKELRFKKLPKYPNKLKMYTEGDDLARFRPPTLNQELTVSEGWRAKQEEDRVVLQKFVGAAGSALCLSVDNLRADPRNPRTSFGYPRSRLLVAGGEACPGAKDSVQRIRDTSLIKEVFNKKPWNANKRFGKNYGNKRFAKNYGDKGANRNKKTPFRSYDQRFRKGRKKPFDLNKKGDKKRKKDD